MAKKTSGSVNPAESESEISFEESLMELQQIVGGLEEGTLGLEESMQRFEKGIKLLRDCYRVLEQAEQRIEILTGTDADGNPVIAPFDATATIDLPKRSAGKRKSKKPSEQSDKSDTQADEENPDKRLF